MGGILVAINRDTKSLIASNQVSWTFFVLFIFYDCLIENNEWIDAKFQKQRIFSLENKFYKLIYVGGKNISTVYIYFTVELVAIPNISAHIFFILLFLCSALNYIVDCSV